MGDSLFVGTIVCCVALASGQISKRTSFLPAVVVEIVLGAIVEAVLQLNGVGQLPSIVASLGLFALTMATGLGLGVNDLVSELSRGIRIAVVGVMSMFILSFSVLGFVDIPFRARLIYSIAFVSTSIAISARAFVSSSTLDSKVARLVLSAAVVDDILGLASLLGAQLLVASGTAQVSLSETAPLIFSVVLPAVLFLASRSLANRTVVLMAVVVVGVVLGLLIGVSVVILGFFAGIALAGKTSFAKVHRAVDFASINLSPVFFFAVGLRVHLSPLASFQAIELMVLLMVTLVISRALCGFTGTSVAKDRLVIGVAMLPRGEVSLVVLAFGLANGVIGERGFGVGVGIIVLGALVAPFLLGRLVSPRG